MARTPYKWFNINRIGPGKRVNGKSGKVKTTIFWPHYSGKCRTVGTRKNHERVTASRQIEKTVDTRHWINYKKSCCLRIGPRRNVWCANITSLTGQVLLWTNVIGYFGIFIVQSRTFKCSIDEAKRSFYRAANAIFGKIGRFAFEEVTSNARGYDKMTTFSTNISLYLRNGDS